MRFAALVLLVASCGTSAQPCDASVAGKWTEIRPPAPVFSHRLELRANGTAIDQVTLTDGSHWETDSAWSLEDGELVVNRMAVECSMNGDDRARLDGGLYARARP